MNKTISWCLFISVTLGLGLISIFRPNYLGDDNEFLKIFVTHEILSFLGVVVAITLASLGNLHIELNKIEEKLNGDVFNNTRIAIKRSAFSLILLISLELIIVTIKPLVKCSGIFEAILNSSSLLIVLANILILLDITVLTFKINPKDYKPE